MISPFCLKKKHTVVFDLGLILIGLLNLLKLLNADNMINRKYF